MVGPLLPIRPAVAITGVDILVLVLCLHVWLVLAGLAVRNDDAQTGIAWADQRIHMSTRLYSGLLLLATIVVWLPFATGQYPIGSNTPFGRTRTVIVPVGVASLLVGVGFYFLGGLVTNLRSYLTVRRIDPVEAAAVEPGPVQISGRVVPIDEPVAAPLTGTDAVCYQLSATRKSGGQAADAEATRTKELGSIDDRTGFQVASVATETSLLDDTRSQFAIRDDTGSVVVDPTAAELRLERTASAFVPETERAPDPLARHLLETPGLNPADHDRRYHEATIEPGDELTVLGVATGETDRSVATGEMDRSVNADEPTITASDHHREFVVAPGCDQQVDRHYRTTIAGCAVATIALVGSGVWLLSLLAGH